MDFVESVVWKEVRLLGEKISTFKFLGLTFNVGNLVAGTLAAAIVFFVVYALSRHLEIKPTTMKQNVFEWMADFTNGIVKGTINGKDAHKFNLYAFTLFFFIFVLSKKPTFWWKSVTVGNLEKNMLNKKYRKNLCI